MEIKANKKLEGNNWQINFETTVVNSLYSDCEVKIEPQYQYDLSTVSITLLTSARNINHKNIE